jgi:hypothetical protein
MITRRPVDIKLWPLRAVRRGTPAKTHFRLDNRLQLP